MKIFEDEAIRDLLITFGVVVIIGVVWFNSGGKERAISELLNVSVGQDRPSAYRPPTESGSASNEPWPGYNQTLELRRQTNQIAELNQQIGQIRYEQETGGVIKNKSPLYGKVDVSAIGVGSSDARYEYLVLKADSENTSALNITNWTVVSLETGSAATIGVGTTLPFPGTVNGKEQVMLFPGETAYLVTGMSPISTSFRINKCTGYFQQTQQFYPGVSRGCPRLADEPLPKNQNSLTDACVDFISSIPTCAIPTQYPEYVTFQCRNYIAEEIGYNRCVSKHKNDPDFFSGEWQIYLGRSGILWRSSKEIIELRDAQGATVDRIKY